LIADSAGDLFGTTFDAGSPAGAGIVYELRPPSSQGGAWTESILHRFSYHSINVGLSPWGGLVADKAGNLYGTGWLGGTCGDCGIVFELSPPLVDGMAWNFAIIHSFFGPTFDGMNPQADLTIDAAGNIFGTTASGGKGGCIGGCGVVFELSPSGGEWIETIVHNFPAHGSGENATGGTGAGVIVDASNDLYGTTFGDGGLGTVFKLTPTRRGRWNYQAIYTFKSVSDGAFPLAGVTLDAHGDLFGTTNQGGNPGCYGEGCGTVFSLAPRASGEWKHTVLYGFNATGDGSLPQAGVIFNSAGNLYGTTQEGGTGQNCQIEACGVAFRLTPPTMHGGAWTEAALHTFRAHGDGAIPYGSVVFGKDGRLYGVTEFGGKPSCSANFGCGTVFAVSP